MNRFAKTFIILSSILFFVGIIVYSSVSMSYFISIQEKLIETDVIRVKNDIFQKLNLEVIISKEEYQKIDSNFSDSIKGYMGFQLIQNDYPIYESQNTRDWHINFPWKYKEIKENGILYESGNNKKISFINILSNYQLDFYYSTLDKNIIIKILKVNSLALVSYLFFLILFIVLIAFTNKKEFITSIHEKYLTSDSDGKDYSTIISINALQKITDCIEKSNKMETSFCLAEIVLAKDNFNESFFYNSFTLLNTHLRLIDGYYEFEDKRMMILMPDTTLKETIRIIEEFIARLIEDNVNIIANAGITTLNNREITPTIMIKEAQKALKKSLPKENSVIGFNPDPNLYRDYVARNTTL